ncbi:MAG: FCD domain-containing protein, partial [Nitrospinota bacterium]
DYSMAVFSFHKLLVRTSGNERLISIMNGLFDQIKLMQLKSVTLSGPGDRPLREHRAIIESLERHDPDLAEKLTREHIRNVKSDVLLFLKERSEG